MDIIPSDLNTYGGEAKRLLEDLQSRNERMFLVTALFMNTAKTKQELDNGIFQTAGIAQKYNCSLRRLDYMQEQGLMSSIPLGLNLIPIKRALTTTSTAIFVPFTTQELFMPGESLYYGLNALSNNMIMVDRKKLEDFRNTGFRKIILRKEGNHQRFFCDTGRHHYRRSGRRVLSSCPCPWRAGHPYICCKP